MRKRLTVSEVVNLFLYRNREILYGSSFPKNYTLNEGKRIHNRLGYDQPWLFRKYFWTGKDWWLLLGCPDRLDEKDGVVMELKTFEERNISENTLAGANIQCQLYCWLTGFKKFAIYGHSIYTNKTSKRLDGEFDPAFVGKIIKEAVGLKISLSNFAKTYETIIETIIKEVMLKKEKGGENGKGK